MQLMHYLSLIVCGKPSGPSLSRSAFIAYVQIRLLLFIKNVRYWLTLNWTVGYTLTIFPLKGRVNAREIAVCSLVWNFTRIENEADIFLSCSFRFGGTCTFLFPFQVGLLLCEPAFDEPSPFASHSRLSHEALLNFNQKFLNATERIATIAALLYS